MASRTTSRYTLYLLIFVVVILLFIGLLSGTYSNDAQSTTDDGPSIPRTPQTDSATATVSFVILPPGTGGGE